MAYLQKRLISIGNTAVESFHKFVND